MVESSILNNMIIHNHAFTLFTLLDCLKEGRPKLPDSDPFSRQSADFLSILVRKRIFILNNKFKQSGRI